MAARGHFLPVKRGVRFCGVTTSPIDRTMPADRPKHFSMIREFHLADLFTLANAACGVASVFAAMTFMATGGMRHFFAAAALTPVALIFDTLDGRVARFRHEHSPMGRELDSLSD